MPVKGIIKVETCPTAVIFVKTSHHENHVYTPKPTMTDAVLVIAARLLPMPNMLLLARTAASFALSCEWPDTYVKAPRPMNVALPTKHQHVSAIMGGRVAYRLRDMACSLQIRPFRA